MPDTQPPAFPGVPDGPKTPAVPEVPQVPSAPPQGASPVSDYGTPPPHPGQGYPPPNPYASNPYASTQNAPGQVNSSQYASTQYPAAPYAPGTISPKKGPGALATTSLAFGGVALLGSFIPFVNYFTGFFAFVGLVLGVIALFVKGRKKTLAIVASSISLLALIVSIVLSITYTNLFFSSVDEAIESNSPAVTSEPVDPTEEPSGKSTTGEQGAPAAGDVGSKENPAPIGSSIELSQLGEPTWQVTVNAPTLNADAAITAENSFSETAPAGTSFALLPITTTYIGAETGFPAYVQVGFEAADGTLYSQYDAIAIAPGAIDAITELAPGASASGNIAIAIPTNGVDQGRWVVSSLDGTKFYFAAQ